MLLLNMTGFLFFFLIEFQSTEFQSDILRVISAIKDLVDFEMRFLFQTANSIRFKYHRRNLYSFPYHALVKHNSFELKLIAVYNEVVVTHLAAPFCRAILDRPNFEASFTDSRIDLNKFKGCHHHF